MEDRDDGIGSELNTPKDAPIQGSNQHEQGHIPRDRAHNENEEVASTAATCLAMTSTPLCNRRPERFEMSAISPIGANQEGRDMKQECEKQRENGEPSDDVRSYTKIEITAKLASRQAEVIQLRNAVEDLNRELTAREKKIDQLEGENKSMRATLDSICAERDNMKKKIKEKDVKLGKQHVELADYQQKLQMAEQKLMVLKNSSVESKKEELPNESESSENTELRSRITSLERKLQEKEAARGEVANRYELENHQLKIKIAQMENMLREERSLRRYESKELQKKTETKVFELERQLAGRQALNADLKDLKDSMIIMKKELEAVSKLRDDLKSKLLEMESGYRAKTVEVTEKFDALYGEMEKDNLSLKGNLENLRRTIKTKETAWKNEMSALKSASLTKERELKDENSDMQRRLEELQSLNDEQAAAVRALRVNKKKLEDELNAERKVRKELEDKLTSAQKNEEVNYLNERIKALTDENAAFVSKMEAAQEKSTNVFENLKKEAAETEEALKKQMETMKTAYEDEIKVLTKTKSDLGKQIADLVTSNRDLLNEKRALLNTDNKERKELHHWQESAKSLSAMIAQRTRDLQECQKENEVLKTKLADSDALSSEITELEEKLREQADEANRFRDEAMFLRNRLRAGQVTEMNKEQWPTEKNEMIMEIEHLNKKIEKLKNVEENFEKLKTQHSELSKMLDQRTSQFKECENALEKTKFDLGYMEDNCRQLNERIAKLESILETKQVELEGFKAAAEMQYGMDMTEMMENIHDRDERINHLHERLARFESYPGKASGIMALDEAGVTLWDTIPEVTRLELMQLKDKYTDLNRIVLSLKTNPPVNDSAVSKAFVDKSTNCSLLPIPPSLSKAASRSESRQTEAGLTVYDPQSSTGASSESLPAALIGRRNDESECMDILLDEISCAKGQSKLTPNIQQLLRHLISEVRSSDKSHEQINNAVQKFFVNLDLALRKTLAVSEDNMQKLAMDLRAVQKNCSDYRTKYSHLESTLNVYKEMAEAESERAAERHAELMRSLRENDELTEQVHRFHDEIRRVKIEAARIATEDSKKADTLKVLRQQLKEAQNSEDQTHEQLRKLSQEKERLKRNLIERDNEIVRIQGQLIERTEQCTLRSSELQQVEKNAQCLTHENERLTRKVIKREKFLSQMERLLYTMKERVDTLKKSNDLRLKLIGKMMRLLAKMGCDLNDLSTVQKFMVHNERATHNNRILKNKRHQRFSHTGRLRAKTLASDILKNAKRVEMLEIGEESGEFAIPSMRSGSRSISSAGSHYSINSLHLR